MPGHLGVVCLYANGDDLIGQRRLGRQPVGDMRTQSVGEIWEGPEMRRIRDVHQRAMGKETFAPCRDCYLPRKTRKVRDNAGGRVIYLDDLTNRPQVIGQ